MTMPDSVTEIEYEAFAGCIGLTEVNIPNSVISLNGFNGCTGLKKVNISNSVTTIKSGAFSGCTGLTEVDIPGSVTVIERDAFTLCTGLTYIRLLDGEKLLSIDYVAFNTWTSDSIWEMISSIERLYLGRNLTEANQISPFGRNLKELTIGNSVTSIPEGAFRGCRKLTDVTIPNAVTFIGRDAFRSCTALADVKISDGEEELELGEGSLSTGTPLRLYVGRNLKSNVINHHFSISSTLSELTIGGCVTAIGESVFSDCYNLSKVIISNSVTCIEYGAFSRCDGLTEVTIPNSVTSLNGFSQCKNLKKIYIPNSVTYIGDYAFSDCTGLTEIGIPNSVTSIGDHAFSDCTGLTEICIPNSVTSIGDCAFSNCKGLTEIGIPNSVITIGRSAFYGIFALTEIEIPNSVTNIGSGAFSECINIQDIRILDGTDELTIGSYIFDRTFNSIKRLYLGRNLKLESADHNSPLVGSLKELTIGNSVTSIPENAFSYCNVLTEVSIPVSVRFIGRQAFAYCPDLTDLKILDGEGEIIFDDSSDLPFKNSPIELLYLGRNISFKGDGLYDIPYFGKKLTELTIGNSVTSIADNMFYCCSGLTEVIFPNSITHIGARAFKNCTGLTEVIFSDSITHIGDYAFDDCSGLTEVTIPNSVAYIGSCAFSGSNIENVTIEDGAEEIKIGTGAFGGRIKRLYLGRTDTSKEWSAFADQAYLTDLTIGVKVTSIKYSSFQCCKRLTKLIIPNSVLTIGSEAFIECTGLTEVELGNSLTTIGYMAFASCYKLAKVNIPNSVTTIKKEAFADCKSLVELTLPESPISIFNKVFANCNNLKLIVSNSVIPSSIESDSFDQSHYSTVELQVPFEAIESYKSNGIWRRFINIIGLESRIPVEELQINPTEWNGTIGSEFSITAKVFPVNATDKSITWKSSDTEVATVSSTGDVKVVGLGKCDISVETNDGSNLIAICHLISNGVSNIEDIANDEIRIRVYTIQGVCVYEGSKKNANLEPGLYIVETPDQVEKILVK